MIGELKTSPPTPSKACLPAGRGESENRTLNFKLRTPNFNLMKPLITQTTKAIFLLFFLAAVWQVQAQVPEKFNYQLAVRDAQGNVYASQQLSFRVSILQGSTVLYQETHGTQSNAYGLVNLMIGDGTPTQGSMAAIDWGGAAKSLKVEFDPTGGSSYAELATTPLLSVPYALYAKQAGDGGSGLTIGGANTNVQFNNNGMLDGSPNFIFIPATNRVGIGTSNPLATLHVQSGQTGVFGWATNESGNTVGGRFQSSSSSGTGVYGISDYKGVVGMAEATSGSAVGGDFQSASADGKGVVGLAIATTGSTYGGFFNSNSPDGRGVFGSAPFIAIQGNASGTSGATYGGHFTSSSTGGTGVYTDASASSGTNYGIRAYTSSAQGFSGYFSGGKFYISGRTGIGTNSPAAGLHVKGTGFPDSFIYIQSNLTNDAGIRIYQGDLAQWHIFNNFSAGGLQIYNSEFTTAIFAKQTNSYVGIRNTDPTQALDVNGNARIRAIGSGVYAGVVNRMADGTLTTSTSDIRLKENVQTLQGGLDKILQLRGVSFTWINHPEYGQRIGFIAQEMEEILPELVFTNEVDGYKGINYAEVTAVLTEAIKELKAEVDRLQDENDRLKVNEAQTNARLERLEKTLENLSEK